MGRTAQETNTTEFRAAQQTTLVLTVVTSEGGCVWQHLDCGSLSQTGWRLGQRREDRDVESTQKKHRRVWCAGRYSDCGDDGQPSETTNHHHNMNIIAMIWR